jgi:hypothetical protein
MNSRCNNPNEPAYKWYGGRGIKLSEPWRSLQVFFNDMASSYRRGLQIERIDNNAGYSKENCVWATTFQQSRNKRNTKLLDTPAGPLIAKDAASHFGLSIYHAQKQFPVFKESRT